MHKDDKKTKPDSAVKTKSRLDVAGSNWEKFKHLVNVKNTPKDTQNDKHENHNHKPRKNKKLNYAAKAAGNKKKVSFTMFPSKLFFFFICLSTNS